MAKRSDRIADGADNRLLLLCEGGRVPPSLHPVAGGEASPSGAQSASYRFDSWI
jgi:hypothetical protein